MTIKSQVKYVLEYNFKKKIKPCMKFDCISWLVPVSPNSDQHQVSPNNIIIRSKEKQYNKKCMENRKEKIYVDIKV